MFHPQWQQRLSRVFNSFSRSKGRKKYRPVQSTRLGVETLEKRVTPTTYTPTTTSDLTFTSVNSANGVITGGTGNGQVTLRSAFIAANAHSGTDTINIP